MRRPGERADGVRRAGGRALERLRQFQRERGLEERRPGRRPAEREEGSGQDRPERDAEGTPEHDERA